MISPMSVSHRKMSRFDGGVLLITESVLRCHRGLVVSNVTNLAANWPFS